MDLETLITEQTDDAVYNITQSLRNSGSQHYGIMETDDLRPRIRRLFDAFCQSLLNQNEEPIRQFISKKGGNLTEEGYSHQETQLAINTLFDEIWKTVAEKSSPEEVVSNLWRVVVTVGWAKEELERVYLRHFENVESKLNGLSPRFEDYLEAKQSAEKDKEKE